MKGVPPEIDDLMWRLAEDGGPVAQAEFEARHARFGPELTRRIRMVAQLREAGKAVAHRPAFTPRPVRVAPTPRWTLVGAVGLAALAMGAVAYVLASGAQAPTIVQAPPPKADPSPAVKIETPEVRKVEETPLPPVVPKRPATLPEEPPVGRKPVDVQVTDTSLVAAIQLVAADGGLAVEIAPGFPDRKVSFDYRGLDPIEMLKAMGEANGFSVLEQEEGHVLVVPVREAIDPVRRIGG